MCETERILVGVLYFVFPLKYVLLQFLVTKTKKTQLKFATMTMTLFCFVLRKEPNTKRKFTTFLRASEVFRKKITDDVLRVEVWGEISEAP